MFGSSSGGGTVQLGSLLEMYDLLNDVSTFIKFVQLQLLYYQVVYP
jgi:hypothetical protein